MGANSSPAPATWRSAEGSPAPLLPTHSSSGEGLLQATPQRRSSGRASAWGGEEDLEEGLLPSPGVGPGGSAEQRRGGGGGASRNASRELDDRAESKKLPKPGGGSGPAGGVGGGVNRRALTAGFCYCLSSCAMILLNKLVLSVFHWEAQITLMLYQNLVSVAVVSLLSALRLIQTEPISWRLVRIWAPVNLIFVGMLVTSFFSLQYMQVAMVTILKNTTNLITACGEMYLFNKRHTPRVWGSLFLMIVSALCGGVTDLSFHAQGYAWQMLNCLFTAAYSLTLRKVMDVAKAATKSGTLSEFSMVLLNNSLSLPLAGILILAFGELPYVYHSPLLQNTGFWVATTLSGLLGLSISFTSMWFLHETSPTTYSLVGSLNKIPLSIAGIVLFKAPTSAANLGSIMFGCFAGVLFARAKMMG